MDGARRQGGTPTISTLLAAMVLAVVAAGPTGGADRNLPFIGRKKVTDESIERTLDYLTVGSDSGIQGLETVKVEGIGLVVGLEGTGSDPPPNAYRDRILAIMRKHEVENPNELLDSDQTSVVLLRAFIPPGARKDDKVDVEVWVPPGDATTSLKGGRLLEASLTGSVLAKGRRLRGNELLRVKGPILVNESESQADAPGLRRGTVLGQGRILENRDFRIVLPSNARSGRRTKLLANRINLRFAIRDRFGKQAVADAKSDQIIELKLLPSYKYNSRRFLHVVRRIPISGSQTFQHDLMTRLETLLHKPLTTLDAAMRLESLGTIAVPVLVRGLESDEEIVRFSCAEALAYLGETEGVDTLERLARDSTEFRAYTLSALYALDHPKARMALSNLLHADSSEARYGAFRVLWARNEMDPLVVGNPIGEDVFLHEVGSDGPPMVHLSRSFRREIVLFGKNQVLKTPLILKSGNLVINASIHNESAFLASFVQTPAGVQRFREESSLQLVDVIAKAAKLGATYPDLVEILRQAHENGNLQGRLEINAIPRAIDLETLSVIASSDQEFISQRPSPVATPTLFPSDAKPDRDDAFNVSKTEDQKDEDVTRTESAKKSLWRRIFRRPAN